MASVYSIAGNDGYILSSRQSSFDVARDASTGVSEGASSSTSSVAISAAHYPVRGGGERWQIVRAVLWFETDELSSGLINTDDDVTLKLFQYANRTADFFVVKSTHSGITTGEFDSITGWGGSGNQEGNVTKYSAEVDASGLSTSVYSDIILNAAAITDMENLNDFKICLIESVHDLRDSDSGLDGSVPPAEQFSTGHYYSDNAGESKDPYISYSLAAAPVANNATFFGANF